MANFVSREILDEAIDFIQQSPSDEGVIELIVCRPEIGQRSVLEQVELDTEKGMLGDNWQSRWNPKKVTLDKYRSMQITLMNSRAINAIADGKKALWPLAGDQFFVDFDLDEKNIPPGTQLQLGSAVVEVTAEPHLACKQFLDRFGRDAVMFANSDIGKSIKLRGVNAKVVSGGIVTTGALVRKLPPA